MKIEGLKGRELFDYLHKNRAAIIAAKKSATKYADGAKQTASILRAPFERFANKHLYENDVQSGVLKRTIVLNTYNWMDSHGDVHLDNLFSKSISERGKRIPHLHDHKFELSARVGYPIGFTEKSITWKELNVNKPGSTMALFMESEIRKSLNEKIYQAYLNDEIDQHSVGMGYVKVDLAINNKDYLEEFAVWKSVIDRIGNREAAEKAGYFYAVREARLIEGSAVLLGSNELTPTLTNKMFDLYHPKPMVKKKLNVADILKYYRF